MILQQCLWLSPVAAGLLLATTASAQVERETLDREYVITTEDPNVYYDFGEEGWRSEARNYNDWENEQREMDGDQTQDAPVDQKYLTNVEAEERESAEEGVEVIYRDIGGEEENGDQAAGQEQRAQQNQQRAQQNQQRAQQNQQRTQQDPQRAQQNQQRAQQDPQRAQPNQQRAQQDPQRAQQNQQRAQQNQRERTAQSREETYERGRRSVSPQRYERGTAPNTLRNRGYADWDSEDPAYFNYWDQDADIHVERVPAGDRSYPRGATPRTYRERDFDAPLERGERRIGGTRGYVERHDNYADEHDIDFRSPRFDRFSERDADWRQPRQNAERNDQRRPSDSEPYRVRGEDVDVNIDVEEDIVAPQETSPSYQEAGAGPNVPARPESRETATARAEEAVSEQERQPAQDQTNAPEPDNGYEADDFVVEDPANLSAPEPNAEALLERQRQQQQRP